MTTWFRRVSPELQPDGVWEWAGEMPSTQIKKCGTRYGKKLDKLLTA